MYLILQSNLSSHQLCYKATFQQNISELLVSLPLSPRHQSTPHHHVINPFNRIEQCSAACLLVQLKVIRQMSNCRPHVPIRNRRNTRHVFASGRKYAGTANLAGWVIFGVHQIWFGVICAQSPAPNEAHMALVFLIRTAGTARYPLDIFYSGQTIKCL